MPQCPHQMLELISSILSEIYSVGCVPPQPSYALLCDPSIISAVYIKISHCLCFLTQFCCQPYLLYFIIPF